MFAFALVFSLVFSGCAAQSGPIEWSDPSQRKIEAPVAPAGVDLVHVSGESLESLDSLAAPGKLTIVDFYAPWCAPCRDVDRYVYRRLGGRADVAYRKIDIGDWETPVAKRWLGSVETLPYLVVYGKDGKKIREVMGLDFEALEAIFAHSVSPSGAEGSAKDT